MPAKAIDLRGYLFRIADERGCEVEDVEAYPQSRLMEWLEFFRRKYEPPKD